VQEKVEEDRYIRHQEAMAAEKIKADAEAKKAKQMTETQAAKHEELEKARAALMNTAISELGDMLLKTGDKISKEGAKNVALWKLGDKYNF